jgi:hypothetical protein
MDGADDELGLRSCPRRCSPFLATGTRINAKAPMNEKRMILMGVLVMCLMTIASFP